MKAKKRKRRKRIRLQPRFFVILFTLFIFGGLFYQVRDHNPEYSMTNFHGWLASEVEEYVRNRPNMGLIFEVAHSDAIEPTRVMGQSIQPGRVIGDEAVVVSVTISLGKEVTP